MGEELLSDAAQAEGARGGGRRRGGQDGHEGRGEAEAPPPPAAAAAARLPSTQIGFGGLVARTLVPILKGNNEEA